MISMTSIVLQDRVIELERRIARERQARGAHDWYVASLEAEKADAVDALNRHRRSRSAR